jgi:hypothetical protein
MAAVQLRCPRGDCGVDFEFSYDPLQAPFRGEPGDRPNGRCPNGHSFSYARVFRVPQERWLFTEFHFDYEKTD